MRKLVWMLLALLLLVGGPAQAETWQRIISTRIGEIYVDLDSLQRLPSGAVDFWERIVYSEDGLRFALSQMGKAGDSEAFVQKHATMVETRTLWRWEPASKRYQGLKRVRYGPGDSVLSSSEWAESEARWRPIQPGGWMDSLTREVETLAPR